MQFKELEFLTNSRLIKWFNPYSFRTTNLYEDNEDIRFQDGKQTPVNEGDELSIIPAIAGGNYQSLRMC